MKAHFGLVTSCKFSPKGEALFTGGTEAYHTNTNPDPEDPNLLFTGGTDNQILPWRPLSDQAHPESRTLAVGGSVDGAVAVENVDMWSDDDG